MSDPCPAREDDGATSRWGKPLFLLSLGIALVLGLGNLGNQYLWQDEAQTALLARSVLEFGVPKGYDGKNHFSQQLGAEYDQEYRWRWHTWLPFYVLAAFFGSLGESTWVARLPFVLFGIGTVALVYPVGRRLWRDGPTAGLACLVLSLSVPYLILIRQCRYYSPTAFFTLLGLYGYLLLLERRRGGPVLGLALILLFHTFYLNAVTLGLALTIHALVLARSRWKPVALWMTLAGLVCAPWAIWISGIKYGPEHGQEIFDLSRAGAQALEYLGKLESHMLPWPWLAVFLLIIAFSRLRNRTHRSFDPGSFDPGPIALVLLVVAANLAVVSVVSPRPFFRYLTPILPVMALLMGWMLRRAMRLHWILGILLVGFFLVRGKMGDFLYEITHDYDGPIEGIVRHLSRHGSEEDVVAITYGDLPLKFYTRMRVIGGLTGEDLEPARTADWVILRRHGVARDDAHVLRFFLDNIDLGNYHEVVLDYPDTRFENREEPSRHRFRTADAEAPVVLLRRNSP